MRYLVAPYILDIFKVFLRYLQLETSPVKTLIVQFAYLVSAEEDIFISAPVYLK